jgi:predicted GTPase
MEITKITAKAWEIRKEVAKEIGCNVSEVLWSECLKLASECDASKLATLTGSEKQIKWATDIRGELLNGYNHVKSGLYFEIEQLAEKISYNSEIVRTGVSPRGRVIKNTQRYSEGLAIAERKLKNALQLLKSVKTETSAVWFIDNRNWEILFTKTIHENKYPIGM